MKTFRRCRFPFLRPKKFCVTESERGYILIAVLFALTIMIIALAAAAPAIATTIRRDREDDLIHRGRQYTRGIQLYFRKFGRYPNSIEQLEGTNNVRFLRRKYKDPMTGSDEWRLIHFGQAKPKPRPSYISGATPAGNLGAGIGGPATSGSGPSGIGPAVSGGANPASGGTGASGTGISGAANASDISRPLSNGPTLGAGSPIVGIASTSQKDSIKEIDGKTKYNEWEFVYDPTLDPSRRGGQSTNPVSPPGGRDGRGSRPGGPPVGPPPGSNPQ